MPLRPEVRKDNIDSTARSPTQFSTGRIVSQQQLFLVHSSDFFGDLSLLRLLLRFRQFRLRQKDAGDFSPAKLPSLMSVLAHTVIQATNRMADPRAAPNRQAKAAVMMVCIICLRYIVTTQAN